MKKGFWDMAGTHKVRHFDPSLAELPSGDGCILASAELQGRIFCEIDGDLVHLFDPDAAASSAPNGEFRNIGGNSLWPAPEGGPFAFNYLPDTQWIVQPDINLKPASFTFQSSSSAVMEKTLSLGNRKGSRLKFRLSRSVHSLNSKSMASSFGLKSCGYRTLDSLCALNAVKLEDALFCSWSLEQLPGSDGITVFGIMDSDAENSINKAFYGDPSYRIHCDGGFFHIALGSGDRFQIGLPHSASPRIIGSCDPARSTLVIRRSWLQDGLYFDIADNDQPDGPFTSEDAFSIFSGETLAFHELETIAPLQVSHDGLASESHLWSETLILKGSPHSLASCLINAFAIPERHTSKIITLWELNILWRPRKSGDVLL